MPEAVIQVAPDSTGSKLRTRSRTVGANTVHEQYVIASPTDAVPVNRVWFSTLRIPVPQTAAAIAAAGTLGLCGIWNGITAGGNSVSVRRLSIEVDTAAVHAAASPVVRVLRMSTAVTGGTLITPEKQYTADSAFSTSVVVRANHAGDGAAGASFALGTLATQPMWAQTLPRMQGTSATTTGFYVPAEFNLLPNDSNLMAVDPLILRPQEGVGIQLLAPAATPATVGVWTIMVKAVLAEFTYP